MNTQAFEAGMRQVRSAERAPLEADPRWRKVVAREADDGFVFAVRTTGIYCRSSCPARTPKRENVIVLPTPADARRLGFRACRRCRPDEAGGNALETEAVTTIARMIDEAVAADRAVPPLAALALKAGYSPFHFHRMFKRVLGVTPKAYGAAARGRRVESELREAGSVTEAIYGAGFSSSSRFYETAAARLGMTPKAARRGASGEVIRYGFAPCSLGTLLVAATEAGVCCVEFGEMREALEASLALRFPAATLQAGGPDFAATLREVATLVETPERGATVPLDVRGTAFQERVWRALRAIPPGTTASYQDIARAIGQPTASRGVAQACAANPVAVAIPCHRVVRQDGALSGYRWGTGRKAALLAREGAR